MMDLTIQMMVQLIECIPVAFGVYLIFNFTRLILFKE